MSGDRSLLPGYLFEGRGPAQRRLVSWLRERVPDCAFDSAVAQRSPAGPWAIKVHAPNRVPTCAALLQVEPWVDNVAVRPQHLYVRVTAERLIAWVVEAFAPGAAAEGSGPVEGSEGRGRTVLVRAADVDALAAAGVPRSLRTFRETAVARSVAAMLRSRGFEVQLELLPPGRETYDDVWAAAPGSATHTLVVGSGVPMPSEVERRDHVVQLPVGEVDVRHGPLRARNGGSLSADDVVDEVVRGVPGELRELLEAAPSSGGVASPEDALEAYGEAVLTLLLLATPRARRIQLDDSAVTREAETYRCLVTMPVQAPEADGEGAVRAPRGAAAAEAARDLAAELDLIATNAGRGAAALDPALIARSLRSLAERGEQLALAGTVPPEHELWEAARGAVGVTLGLAGSAPVGIQPRAGVAAPEGLPSGA